MTQLTLTLNETIGDWSIHAIKIKSGWARGRWDVFVQHTGGNRIPMGLNAHARETVEKETARLRAVVA